MDFGPLHLAAESHLHTLTLAWRALLKYPRYRKPQSLDEFRGHLPTTPRPDPGPLPRVIMVEVDTHQREEVR